MSIKVTHNWQAEQWDWPLQRNDGIVKIKENNNNWEVGIDAQWFTPNEINVSVIDNIISISLKHENRNDKHGIISREINRSYHVPDDVDATTIKSHLTSHGVLHITAQKKH